MFMHFYIAKKKLPGFRNSVIKFRIDFDHRFILVQTWTGT